MSIFYSAAVRHPHTTGKKKALSTATPLARHFSVRPPASRRWRARTRPDHTSAAAPEKKTQKCVRFFVVRTNGRRKPRHQHPPMCARARCRVSPCAARRRPCASTWVGSPLQSAPRSLSPRSIARRLLSIELSVEACARPARSGHARTMLCCSACNCKYMCARVRDRERRRACVFPARFFRNMLNY